MLEKDEVMIAFSKKIVDLAKKYDLNKGDLIELLITSCVQQLPNSKQAEEEFVDLCRELYVITQQSRPPEEHIRVVRWGKSKGKDA